jgi:Uma2 family endonuclease
MTPEIAKRRGFCEVCPDLVAEVLSPNDVTAEVTRKRREWLAAGARLVWIIDPEDQSVTAYPAGERPVVYQVADTLSGDPVLPGLVIPLADLFRLPTAPPPQPPPQ